MSERDTAAESEAEREVSLRAEKTAELVIEKLKKLSLKLVLAESCTAGLVSGLLANTSGASSVLWGSFVCYTQEAKVSMLALDNDALNAHGLVSRETACSMAQGALQNSGADIAVSVTGLAGPDGDGRAKVGTIWTAVALRGGKIEPKEFFFTGSRNLVRIHAVNSALEIILNKLSETA